MTDSLEPLSAEGEEVGTCLLCHAVDSAVSRHGLNQGQYWWCSRCGQIWDAMRLSTARAYARVLAAEQQVSETQLRPPSFRPCQSLRTPQRVEQARR